MNTPLRTLQEAQQWLSEQGLANAEVARRFGVTPSLVDAILRGDKPCKRGASHNIAVFLGIKAGQAVATKQVQNTTPAIADTAAPAEDRSAEPPATHGQATVLVVDDSDDTLMVMSLLLGGTYHVMTADNGMQALEMAVASPRPDLILLDIQMPEMDGYEVCRRLKAQSHTSDIPVIFLTGSTRTEDELIGLGMGATDYITKPVNADILLARIKTHLNLKAQADWLRHKNRFLASKLAQLGDEISAIHDVDQRTDVTAKRNANLP